MLELLDKDFRVAIIKILQQTITNTVETNEKSKSKLRNKYRETLKWNVRTEK